MGGKGGGARVEGCVDDMEEEYGEIRKGRAALPGGVQSVCSRDGKRISGFSKHRLIRLVCAIRPSSPVERTRSFWFNSIRLLLGPGFFVRPSVRPTTQAATSSRAQASTQGL